MAPAWKTNGHNNGIGAKFVIFNFHNLKWLACTDYGACLNGRCRCKYFASVGTNLLHSSTTIVDRSNFTVTTIFNFHKLKKWVVCAHCGAPMKDRWVQQWDWCPSVLQAGATIFNSSNFIVTTVFNFHNLNKWVVCATWGTHLKDRWVQQWDQHPSILQASTALFNRSNFIVTTVFKFHNLKKWVACAAILNRLNFMLIIYMMVGTEHYLLLTHGKEINGCSRWAP